MGTNIFTKLLLLAVLFTIGKSALAQSHYCYNQMGRHIDFPTKRKDSLYLDYDRTNGHVKIINPTRDTLYLFSSYFDRDLQSSRYLHEIDTKNKTYYISFVPIVSYLTTKRTDKIILGEESIAHKGQILYDFIKLAPNTYYVIEFNPNDLFRNSASTGNAVKCYDNSSLSKFKEVSFKPLTTSKLAGKYNLILQFAVYANVKVLCRESDYYLNELEFDKQAKSFRTINIPIILNNADYPLFR